MRFALYTLARLGLILAAGVLLYLAGMRSWLLWITAILVGSMVSFLVLRRATAEVSQSLTSFRPRRASRGRSQAQQDAADEDALIDTAEEPLPGADAASSAAHDVAAPAAPVEPAAPSEVEGGRRDEGHGEEPPVDEDQRSRS